MQDFFPRKVARAKQTVITYLCTACDFPLFVLMFRVKRTKARSFLLISPGPTVVATKTERNKQRVIYLKYE